ncbi:MAG: hypothetical protein ACKOYP_06750 [Bacteroidota bacterium]
MSCLSSVMMVAGHFVALAQGSLEPSLSLRELSQSERFRTNSRLMINGILAPSTAWQSLMVPENPAVRLTFLKDSVFIETADAAGNRLAVSFPNDITLLTNADRKDLQDRLLVRLKDHPGRLSAATHTVNPVWINTARSGTRFGLLSAMTFTDSATMKPVCHPGFSTYSLINALSDTLSCDGLFPVRLVLHRYANKTDTLNTTVSGLLRATGASGWSKWSGVEANELTVLLQHPFVGYEHLLFFRKEKNHDRWLADLYPFIPTHNLTGLFTAYSSKSRQELFKIMK